MSYPMPSIISKGLEYILGPNGMGVTGGSTSQTGASGTTGGSSANGSSAGFLPGQSARFTPDPTVNGPWTHTRADIPLFRQAGGVSTPATGGLVQSATSGLPANAIPARPSIPPNTPPAQAAPEGKPRYSPSWGEGFNSYRDILASRTGPRRRDRRTMLADALEGK